MKKELCFKFIVYKNYNEMHGQQNIKFYNSMSFFMDVTILNVRHMSLANTVARLRVRSDKRTGQHYMQRNLFCNTLVISCVQFDNSGLKLLRCVIGQEHFRTVNISSDS